jgi:putative ABC transport system permease protein
MGYAHCPFSNQQRPYEPCSHLARVEVLPRQRQNLVAGALRAAKLVPDRGGILRCAGQRPAQDRYVSTTGRSQDDVVFIPLSAAKSRVLGPVRGATRDALDFISIKVSDATAMSEIERGIEAILRQRHRTRGDAPSDFRIENPADVLFARGAAVRLLSSLLIAVAAVSLVVGGISIMNIMLVSVTERTREIGLRMAVGASRHDIRSQFLIEALILALMGGLVGAMSGAVAAIAIAWKAGWPILISPWAIVLACGFAAFVGISFGLYPAHRAARLDPIIALRFE